MDLPTYTNIWRIEKRLYKLYDLRLPMPLPLVQIGVFVGVFVPWIMLLKLAGIPFRAPWHVLYLIPPAVLTWMATRPVIEGKRLTELLLSQMRYFSEPRTWCRLTPIREPREVMIVARVWRREDGTATALAPERAAVRARRRRKARRPVLEPEPAPHPLRALPYAEPVGDPAWSTGAPAAPPAPAAPRAPAAPPAFGAEPVRVPSTGRAARPWRPTVPREISHESDVPVAGHAARRTPEPPPVSPELERPPATPRLEAAPAAAGPARPRPRTSGKRALASGVRRPGAHAEFWQAIAPPGPTTNGTTSDEDPTADVAHTANLPGSAVGERTSDDGRAGADVSARADVVRAKAASSEASEEALRGRPGEDGRDAAEAGVPASGVSGRANAGASAHHAGSLSGEAATGSPEDGVAAGDDGARQGAVAPTGASDERAPAGSAVRDEAVRDEGVPATGGFGDERADVHERGDVAAGVPASGVPGAFGGAGRSAPVRDEEVSSAPADDADVSGAPVRAGDTAPAAVRSVDAGEPGERAGDAAPASVRGGAAGESGERVGDAASASVSGGAAGESGDGAADQDDAEVSGGSRAAALLSRDPGARGGTGEAAGERAADERAADERAADERAADERAAGERAAGERAAGETAAGERAADERAAGVRAAGVPEGASDSAVEPAGLAEVDAGASGIERSGDAEGAAGEPAPVRAADDAGRTASGGGIGGGAVPDDVARGERVGAASGAEGGDHAEDVGDSGSVAPQEVAGRARGVEPVAPRAAGDGRFRARAAEDGESGDRRVAGRKRAAREDGQAGEAERGERVRDRATTRPDIPQRAASEGGPGERDTRPDIPRRGSATRPDIPMVPGAFGRSGSGSDETPPEQPAEPAARERQRPPKPWTEGLSRPPRAARTDALVWPPLPPAPDRRRPRESGAPEPHWPAAPPGRPSGRPVRPEQGAAPPPSQTERWPQPPLPPAAPPPEAAQPPEPPREMRSGPASPVRPRPLPPPPAPPPPGPAITPPEPEHEVTPGGLRRLFHAVGGGHSQVDEEYEERLQRPFQGTRHIVVLGCTGGAGQTVTGLMLGHTFAHYCGEPIVAVDVNPGPGALARRSRSETHETLTGLITRAGQVNTLTAMRRYTSQAKSGLEVIAAGKNPLQALDDRDYALAIRTLDRFYSVTLLDAAAAVVARVLPHADQIVLVAPASSDAPRAVAMTFEWLDGHGYDELRSRAVTVINGVSRRSMDDVEQAEAVARGRCRALVRVPWDDHLSMDRSPRNELKSLRTPTRRAYLALAGVVAGGFTVVPERYQQQERQQEASR